MQKKRLTAGRKVDLYTKIRHPKKVLFSSLSTQYSDLAENPRVICEANLPLWKKLCCGLGSGGLAATLCCPVEVALVRMQADGSAPVESRRGYKHAFDAIIRVAREEGVPTLYRIHFEQNDHFSEFK